MLSGIIYINNQPQNIFLQQLINQLKKSGRACRVWNRLGKLLRRQGTEARVSAMFYRSVFQTVLIFGEDTWFFPEEISRNLEGVHVGFLRQITGQRVVQQEEGTWRQVAAQKVLEKAGTQPLGTYIDRSQATVAEWVALRPILEVYDRDKCYKGGGRRRYPWWR